MDRLVRDSYAGSAVYYCCVLEGKNKVYSYNCGDQELESLADLCLENPPPLHAWYFHTTRRRAYGFLMENGFTYFVIANSSVGSSDSLKFLQYIQDGFRKVSASGFQEELIPVVRQLIASLENIPRSNFPDEMMMMPEGPSTSEEPNLSKMPLLGRYSGKHDKRKMKEREVDGRDTDENHFDRRVDIDTREEPRGAFSLQKTLSSNRLAGQQNARRLWMRHVKMVILVDVMLCLILFVIWLMICRGFECVSRGL